MDTCVSTLKFTYTSSLHLNQGYVVLRCVTESRLTRGQENSVTFDLVYKTNIKFNPSTLFYSEWNWALGTPVARVSSVFNGNRLYRGDTPHPLAPGQLAISDTPPTRLLGLHSINLDSRSNTEGYCAKINISKPSPKGSFPYSNTSDRCT